MRKLQVKFLAALAVLTLFLAFAESASAQAPITVRTRIQLFPFDPLAPAASGHADFDPRDRTNLKMETEVDDIFTTDLVDVWITDSNGENWTYVMSIFLVGGMGETQHEQQRGEFVPQVNHGDLVWVFDAYDYTILYLWGYFQ